MDQLGDLLMEDFQSPKEGVSQPAPRRLPVFNHGVATSFGFKKRPPTAPSLAAARRLASTVDRNGNGRAGGGDTEPLTADAASVGRSTPRLPPPRKEGVATRLNRFGFRQPAKDRAGRVADVCDNGRTHFVDGNRNRMPQHQAQKYMLQSTQLPRPEPIRVIETKTTKTLVNTTRKMAYQEDSSKEGSLTEDSGVGSQIGAGVDILNSSPTFGARRNFHKARNLEIIRNGGNSFDVIDLEENSESCVPLPQLPSAFNNGPENLRGIYNSGFVREKTREYQRHVDDNRRKISITSSEGFSDDYTDEEKPFKDRFKCEKSFVRTSPHKFLKKQGLKDDSSPPSSDEHEWLHGGEAMAEEVSCSISSSDESRDRAPLSLNSIINSSGSSSKFEFKNMILSLEDPKFAAVAATSNSLLLDDETSPVDSVLSYSESEEILKRKINRSSSNSKDINEKLTPPSPGTPTNVSNSLSLSDGKDDFLIDDEIADQPALLFEETIRANDSTLSISQNSESTNTMVDPTLKVKRRNFLGVEGSPLCRKKSYRSRAGSLDTLSPCESIGSDDLMMDFDYSQSSGLEDADLRNENQNNGFSSLDDTFPRKNEESGLRDWSSLLGNYGLDKNGKGTAKSRLLWSRTGTPNSIPDSPKSVDSKSTARSTRNSLNNSPLKLSRATLLSGYDSDDSIRLDRANHSAMKQDIMSMKTMLLKLRRVLNESNEDIMLRSETHIPFDGHLTNGLFNGLSLEDAQDDGKLELAELRRQVLFLQGQLEDKERAVLELQEQMIKLSTESYTSNSAPASTITESVKCNAATQTERIRPISAGPSLLNNGSDAGSLVSASESPPVRRSRPLPQSEPQPKRTSSRLWRQPGEPPSPQRYASSSIPRRANSRTRTSTSSQLS